MKEYKISEEELCSLLQEAYRSGYEGYKDMASSAACRIVKKFLKGRPEATDQLAVRDEIKNSLILTEMEGQRWRIEPESEVTVVGDEPAIIESEIILPNTTLSSWYSIGEQEE